MSQTKRLPTHEGGGDFILLMDSKPEVEAAAWEEADFEKQFEGITDDCERKYVGQSRQAFRNMIERGNEKEGWKFLEKKKETNIWTKRTADGAMGIKCEGIVPFPPEQILEFLFDEVEKLKYDKDQASGKHIASLPLGTDLGYAAYKGRFMISGRDFLYVSMHAKGPDGTIVLAYESTEHPDYPPEKKYVRAHTSLAGWLLKPTA